MFGYGVIFVTLLMSITIWVKLQFNFNILAPVYTLTTCILAIIIVFLLRYITHMLLVYHLLMTSFHIGSIRRLHL